MKNKFTQKNIGILILTGCFSLLQLVSHTYSNSSPPISLTNAPNEGNCTSCHSGGGLITSGNSWNSIKLTANGGALEYFPDSVFNMELSADFSGVTKYGFEITVLDSATNKLYGTFSVTNSTRTVKGTATVSGSSREYIMHKSGGTSAQSGNYISWPFNWKAGSSLPKALKFFTIINGSNSNGGSSGDAIYTRVFTMRPSPQLPTADLVSNKSSYCQGDTVFCIGSGNNVTNWSWEIKSGNSVLQSSQIQNPYFVLSNTGSYKIKLTTSNSKGQATDSSNIQVNTKPTISLTSSNNPILICEPDSVVLTANASGGATIQWSTGQTGSAITVKNSGIYYANSFTSQCKSDTSATITIQVNQKLSSPSLVCANSSLSEITVTWDSIHGAIGFEVSEDSGATWQSPSSGVSGQSHYRNNLSSNSNYILYVRAIDQSPCNYGETSQIVCITQPCSAIAYQVRFDSILCSGQNDTIIFDSIGSTSYAIQLGNFFYKSNQFIVTEKSDSTYLFGLIDSNQTGCPTQWIQIPIKRMSLPTSNLKISRQKSCLGDSVVFEGDSGNTIYNFRDSLGVLIQSGGQRRFYTTDAVIINQGISLTTTNALGCESEPGQLIKGFVPKYKKPTFTITELFQGTYKFLTPSDTGIKSVWEFGDGNKNDSNKKEINHTYKNPGKYSIKLTETIEHCLEDSIQEINYLLTGFLISDNYLGIISYPNPFHDNVSIRLISSCISNATIKLLNISGQEMILLPENLTFTNSELHIATHLLPLGVYILQINSGEGQNAYVKLVKQ